MTHTGTVYVGQRVLVEIEFRVLGAPEDPTIVQLTSRAPSGTSTTYTYPADDFTRRDLGLYEGSVLVDEPGIWAFRVEGAGVVDAVNEFLLNVEPSAVLGG